MGCSGIPISMGPNMGYGSGANRDLAINLANKARDKEKVAQEHRRQAELGQHEMYVKAVKWNRRCRLLMQGVAQEGMTIDEMVMLELARDVGFFEDEMPAELHYDKMPQEDGS